MIPRTVLLKRTVTTDNQRIEAMGQWSRVMAELGMDEPLLVVPPFEITVTACAGLGGKTVVITTITREFKRT
jgi:hypothetical protein